MSEKITLLNEGVEGLFIRNPRFNTTLVSLNFYMPLQYENAAALGLLPFVLTTCSKKYPDFSKLNCKLAKLYGARLEASSEKVGDMQLLKVAVSVIDDSFTLDGEPLCAQACELLEELIFEPKAENGAFCEEDVEREKRKAIEHIRGEVSEKRLYAKKRLIEEMYRGKPYGVSKCGTEEQVAALDGKVLYRAWENMLSSAFVRVNVISRSMPAGLFDGISARFAAHTRRDITDCAVCESTRKARIVRTVTERMDIAQGKLALGFSSRVHGGDAQTLPLLVMCDIFGGGPYSKLFSNVREKMSLCYYCSASAVRTKGLLMVDSGVEAQNADRTYEAILDQLEAIKRGEITDFEFEASVKSLKDSFKTFEDSQASLDTWYCMRVGSGIPRSPAQMAELLNGVDKKAVIKAANGVCLHTVYKLLPEENV